MSRSYHACAVLASITCIGAMVIVTSAFASPPSFTGLGDLEGGTFYSEARGISADGSIIAGFSRSGAGYQPVRWTADGMELLRDPGGNTITGKALGISGDGTTVVGSKDVPGLKYMAFRWTSGDGFLAIPDLKPTHSHSAANDASYDGSVIVGQADSAKGKRAFRWTQETGVVSLGNILDSKPTSTGYAVTPDGNLVVGFGYDADGSPASRWTAQQGMVGLGDLPDGRYESAANAVSENGIIAGYGYAAAGKLPVIWDSSEYPRPLSTDAIALGGEAKGISADGKIVVGTTTTLGAFIWDEVHGIRSLQSILVDEYGLGESLSGWRLDTAFAVSADGTTIVGVGHNPSGATEAWRVVVPEPSGLLLLLSAVVASHMRRPRRQ